MKNEEWLITNSGVNMPRLIYGTAWKKKRTTELVVKAVEAGFRGIDTACQPKHYSESLVGKALQDLQYKGYKRENLFVQTKFTPLKGQDPNNIPYDKHATPRIQVAQSFEVSQKNLRTDYVDSLVLHSPLASHRLLMTVWQAMEVIYKGEEFGPGHSVGFYSPVRVERRRPDRSRQRSDQELRQGMEPSLRKMREARL